MLTTIMAGPDGKSSSLRKLVVEGVDDSPNVQVGGRPYLPYHDPHHPCACSCLVHVPCRPTLCSQPCCPAPAVRLPTATQTSPHPLHPTRR